MEGHRYRGDMTETIWGEIGIIPSIEELGCRMLETRRSDYHMCYCDVIK